MNHPSLTPRSVDAAGVSLCLGVLAVFYFLAIAPLLSQQSEARWAAESVKAENDRIGRLTAALRLTRQSINSTTQRLGRFGGAGPQAATVNERIASLVELAKSLGLQLAETTPGPPRTGKEFDAIPVRIGGRGTLTGIAKFLDTLHTELADVAVETLDIRGGSAGSRDRASDVEFSLLLTSYVEHSARAASAADAGAAPADSPDLP
jgi:Tfp pilus assembly protein PilO